MRALVAAPAALWRRVRRVVWRRFADDIVLCKELLPPDPPAARQRLRLAPIDDALWARVCDLARAVDATEGGASFLTWVTWSRECGFEAWGAFEGERLIGYIWLVRWNHPALGKHPHPLRFGIELREGEGYLYDLMIDAQRRGEGRATEFVVAVHALAQQTGLTRLRGFVRADNIAARTLYRVTGWVETRRQPLLRVAGPLFCCGRRLFLRNGPRARCPVDFRPLL